MGFNLPTVAVAGPAHSTRAGVFSCTTPLLTDKIAALEAELEVELAKRRAELRVGLEKGRVVFEEDILRRHRELRTKLSHYIIRAHPLVALTAPAIYSLIFPFLLLDLFVTVYQAV